MKKKLLHVFRNTPFGRETLLQTAYSCQQLQLSLDVYIPVDKKFLFYFGGEVVQVDLDSSYLFDPQTAQEHAEQTLSQQPGLQYQFIRQASYTATGLPDLPTNFFIMTCPRSISDVSSRIGLGRIGPKVRKIVQQATFPILIPGAAFKPWQQIVVLYGGSSSASNALHLAHTIQQRSQRPLRVISVGDRAMLETMLKEQGLLELVSAHDWQVIPGKSLEKKHLYQIPHDALVILGAYGHGPIKALFGSNMELIQTLLPNPLLIVGPNYKR